MNIIILNIIGAVLLITAITSIALIKRHIRKRLHDIDGFGGIVSADDRAMNIIGEFGEKEKRAG